MNSSIMNGRSIGGGGERTRTPGPQLKLLKIGAVVTVSVGRIKLAFATACPVKDVFTRALERLRSLPTATGAAIAA